MLELDLLKYIFFFFICYTLIPQQDNYQTTSYLLSVSTLSHYPSKTYPLNYLLNTYPFQQVPDELRQFNLSDELVRTQQLDPARQEGRQTSRTRRT